MDNSTDPDLSEMIAILICWTLAFILASQICLTKNWMKHWLQLFFGLFLYWFMSMSNFDAYTCKMAFFIAVFESPVSKALVGMFVHWQDYNGSFWVFCAGWLIFFFVTAELYLYRGLMDIGNPTSGKQKRSLRSLLPFGGKMPLVTIEDNTFAFRTPYFGLSINGGSQPAFNRLQTEAAPRPRPCLPPPHSPPPPPPPEAPFPPWDYSMKTPTPQFGPGKSTLKLAGQGSSQTHSTSDRYVIVPLGANLPNTSFPPATTRPATLPTMTPHLVAVPMLGRSTARVPTTCAAGLIIVLVACRI
ncbi:hypothetical protein K402DRAFT_71731 [Aulographum hederae CBS 113979]|uniref:Uncharacterized protein n=1 Tax=Aulographum hederae CBS 113979 TaxID=1176131 RepID=A0A6G1HFK4_9PEZI|nr:hypothetical protein K402DRAFT_71731 [Aulographum hederae CBS 113979]